MMSIDNAVAEAILTIGDLVGREYIRTHLKGSCEAREGDPKETFEYFIGFEGDDETNLWTVFAYVSVDRTTEEVTVLDYRLPDGTRMKNPVKPVRLAAD